MRQAAPVFDAAKQQSISVGQDHGPSVEDAVNRIWPVFPAEDRIAGMTGEEGVLRVYFQVVLFNGYRGRRYCWKENCIQMETLIS